MARGGDDLGPLVLPYHGAAFHQGREQLLGDVEGGEHLLAPALGAGVQQLAGGGDGGFTGLGAAQGPGEQIGHKQQPVGLFPQLGLLPLQGQQLVQAVDV